MAKFTKPEAYDYIEPISLNLMEYPLQSQSTASSDYLGGQTLTYKDEEELYDANKAKEKKDFAKYFFDKINNKSTK